LVVVLGSKSDGAPIEVMTPLLYLKTNELPLESVAVPNTREPLAEMAAGWTFAVPGRLVQY
jgi:hypothetical protein